MWIWNWWRVLPRWAIILVTVLAVVMVAVVAMVAASLSAADIPCQDGRWDEAQNTCIPDPSVMP